MKQKVKPKSRWKNKRTGFRHELVRTLVDHDFSWGEAKAIVDAVFASIEESLKRRESVTVDEFGTWHVVEPVPARVWRLGRVMILKRKVRFLPEKNVLMGPFQYPWKGHASWKATEAKPPDRRSKKGREYYARLAQEHHEHLLRLYKRVIKGFLNDHAWRVGSNTFWALRWNGPWFKLAAAQHSPTEAELRPIEDAEKIIAETAVAIPPIQENIEIDYIQWYARWTSQLDVDRQIWEEAEEYVRTAQCS